MRDNLQVTIARIYQMEKYFTGVKKKNLTPAFRCSIIPKDAEKSR